FIDLGGGQAVIAGLPGDVDHRRRAQPAVEVIVQQRLGRLRDRLQSQRRRHQVIRSMISGRRTGGVSATLQPAASSAIADSKRSGVSVYSVNSGSPAATGSPGRRWI